MRAWPIIEIVATRLIVVVGECVVVGIHCGPVNPLEAMVRIVPSELTFASIMKSHGNYDYDAIEIARGVVRNCHNERQRS
jgi:hypothetical protein